MIHLHRVVVWLYFGELCPCPLRFTDCGPPERHMPPTAPPPDSVDAIDLGQDVFQRADQIVLPLLALSHMCLQLALERIYI